MKLFIDFETYYDKDYSLSKMTAVEYVRDPRFKIFGCAIRVDNAKPLWISDMRDLRCELDCIAEYQKPGKTLTIIGHNLLFDALILIERIKLPQNLHVTWHDTLSMARGRLITKEYSLGWLSRGLDVQKGEMPSIKGKEVLSGDEWLAVEQYCLRDIEVTEKLYDDLIQGYPEAELDLISLTVDMGVRAKLELHRPTLLEALDEAFQERTDAITHSGVSAKVLGSNPQFANHLINLGYEPPTKVSPATGRDTWAFSKGDLEWVEFKDAHPELDALFAGREASKSNLPVSRAETFLRIEATGKLPVPLQYYGAHTGRFSGIGGMNLQNLPRGSKLRTAIRPGADHLLIIGDFSQIEVRVCAMLAGQEDLLDIFRGGRDPYKAFASKHFQVPEGEVTKEQRQFSKACVLGLGFGMGAAKFGNTVRKGMLGNPPMPIEDDEAQRTVTSYRKINHAIAGLWKEIDNHVLKILEDREDKQEAIQGSIEVITGLPAQTVNDAHEINEVTRKGSGILWRDVLRIHPESIELPTGMMLQYPTAGFYDDGFSFWNGKIRENLYGGKLTENVVQALARILMTNVMLQFRQFCVMSVHDEIVLRVPTLEANDIAAQLNTAMSTAPAWWPGLPLAAAVEISDMYNK